MNEFDDLDSEQQFQMQKMENFNSEFDLYSSIKMSEPKSPGRRRGTLLGRVQPTEIMKAIPAEDSAEERGSETNSNEGSGNGEGEESE